MGIESLPDFTQPARQRWESIPSDIRQRLLSNVWCGHCSHKVTITNFSGTIKDRDLLLVGKCAECHGDVARVSDHLPLGVQIDTDNDAHQLDQIIRAKKH